jgi:hypothetical protein
MASDTSSVTINGLTDREGEADDGGTMWLEDTAVDLTAVYVNSSVAHVSPLRSSMNLVLELVHNRLRVKNVSTTEPWWRIGLHEL